MNFLTFLLLYGGGFSAFLLIMLFGEQVGLQCKFLVDLPDCKLYITQQTISP